MRAPVGRQSPASRRNLEKSEHTRHPRPHSHLHTCPVTSHLRSVPARWASVSARPQEERETFPSADCAGGGGVHGPPPAATPPLPSRRVSGRCPKRGGGPRSGRRRGGGGGRRRRCPCPAAPAGDGASSGGGAGGGQRLRRLQQRGRELAAVAAVVKGIGSGGDGSVDVSVG